MDCPEAIYIFASIWSASIQMNCEISALMSAGACRCAPHHQPVRSPICESPSFSVAYVVCSPEFPAWQP
jgi:hypothetical protein